MILLDIIGLFSAIGVFIYQDRKPWGIEPDGTARPMTLREWLQSDPDDYNREPLDDQAR